MAETITIIKPIIIAGLGGLIPSLVWLWFWLKEDTESPEPNGLIALSFFSAIAIVFFVLPFQKLVLTSITSIMNLVDSLSLYFSILPPLEQTVKITLWSFIEESAKYLVLFVVVLGSEWFDEPIDAVIYLITIALGFAAMENALYIFKDLAQGGTSQILLNGNMRFIGATLVHIVSSASVGFSIAFSFYAPRFVRIAATVTGILVATLLHAYFNLSIMTSEGTLSTLKVFSQFWAAIIGIIILITILKRLPKQISLTK